MQDEDVRVGGTVLAPFTLVVKGQPEWGLRAHLPGRVVEIRARLEAGGSSTLCLVRLRLDCLPFNNIEYIGSAGSYADASNLPGQWTSPSQLEPFNE